MEKMFARQMLDHNSILLTKYSYKSIRKNKKKEYRTWTDNSQSKTFSTWKDFNHANNKWNVNKNNEFHFSPKRTKIQILSYSVLLSTLFGGDKNLYFSEHHFSS